MARIVLADESDIPVEYQGLDLLVTLSSEDDLPAEYHHLIGDPTRNVYRAIARRPPIVQAFREFGGTVWEECGLDTRDREIAILTAARALDSDYEWHQHVRVGLKEGLSPEEIRAIANGNDESFAPREQALIGYVRAYVRGRVDDAVLGTFIERFDEPTAVGVAVLAGIYLLIARFADAFELSTEERFVGWDLEGLRDRS